MLQKKKKKEEWECNVVLVLLRRGLLLFCTEDLQVVHSTKPSSKVLKEFFIGCLICFVKCDYHLHKIFPYPLPFHAYKNRCSKSRTSFGSSLNGCPD